MSCSPVASPKIVSPSNIECAGRIARASPSWATSAIFEASVFESAADVATIPIVVLRLVACPVSWRRSRRRSRSFGDRSPNRSGPHGRAVSGSMALPLALTTASAPTRTVTGVGPGISTVVLAVPTPPCSPPARAPVPAPTDPHECCSARAEAIARRPKSADGRWSNRPARPRSKITAAGTTGTTPIRPSGGPTGNPSDRSSSQATTPSAAANPYALPPVRQTAWIV